MNEGTVTAKEIKDAESFDELYAALEAKGTITGSQRIYQVKEFIDETKKMIGAIEQLIQQGASGTLALFLDDDHPNYIQFTKTDGLRNKIRELFQKFVRENIK